MLAERGFQHHPGAAAPVLPELCRILAGVPIERAGARLYGVHGLPALLDANSTIGSIAATHLGSGARPVRALLFDKSAASNWSLGWHQDRTIVVAERHDTAGFAPWSFKAGLHHVEPPPSLQAAMITLRVHLDAVDADNAPLLIAPGSHRLGRIPQSNVSGVVQRCGIASCIAEPGDVWVYSTPILHASEASTRPRRRRVLQVDYTTKSLPGGLQWLGV